MRHKAIQSIVGFLLLGVSLLIGFGIDTGEKGSTQARAAEDELPPNNRLINANARRTVAEGRQIFRFDTFGSEAFFGDALQLHRAIAGAQNGGVGGGVSPKTALAVGLKVDADALPDELKQQIAAGLVNLDARAAQAECRGWSDWLIRQRREHPVDGHPVRLLPFNRR